MPNQKKLFIFVILLGILMGACQSEPVEVARVVTETMTEDVIVEYEEASYDTADFDDASAGEMGFAANSARMEEAPREPSPAQAQAQERLIIRTGNVDIVVSDTDEALARITQMVEDNGGWVVNSNMYQYRENAKTADMTIRIPASGFQSAMTAIKGLAVDVKSESTSGQDVTEEFVDISARLENLEATADRVRAFLDETRNVEEALEVNMELSRLEGDIEAMKGRLQYLSQSAAFSTISIHLTPDILSQPIEAKGWQAQGIARDAVEALLSTMQGLASLAIWMGIYVLPLAIVLGIPLWLVIRTVRRRRNNGNTAVPTAPSGD